MLSLASLCLSLFLSSSLFLTLLRSTQASVPLLTSTSKILIVRRDRKYSTLVCIKAEYIYKERETPPPLKKKKKTTTTQSTTYTCPSIFLHLSFETSPPQIPEGDSHAGLKEDVCGKEALRSITILLYLFYPYLGAIFTAVIVHRTRAISAIIDRS